MSGAAAKAAGFLFAFYRFSQTEHADMMQRMVHLLTRSDAIHVAVVPVWHCEIDAHRPAVCRALVDPTAYTAFIDCGFEEQATETLLEPEYDFVFMPVAHPERMQAGVDFLRSLHGASYNYRSLPLTILPRSWKRRVALWPNWLTHEQSLVGTATAATTTHTAAVLDHARMMPTTPASPDNRSSNGTPEKQKQVFCSQMGLMLCYVCQTLPHYVADPAGCSPGELMQILREEGCGVRCDRACIRILGGGGGGC